MCACPLHCYSHGSRLRLAHCWYPVTIIWKKCSVFFLPRNLVKKWLCNHIQKGPLKSHLNSVDYLLYVNGLFRWERTIASFLIWNHWSVIKPQPSTCASCLYPFKVLPLLEGRPSLSTSWSSDTWLMLGKEQKDPWRIVEKQAPFKSTLFPVTAVETRH